MSKTHLAFACLFLSLVGRINAQSNEWQPLPGPFGGNIHCVSELNNTWYLGTGNGVYTSTDDGENWQPNNWPMKGQTVTSLLLQPDEYVVAATIVDLEEYFTDDWLGLVYRSTDQGQQWTVDTIRPQFSYGPLSLKVFRQHGYLFAFDDNKLLRSADNGNTWEDILTNNQNFLYFDFNDSILIGDNGIFEISYSTDGGQSWGAVPPPPGASFGDFALGLDNTIFYFESFDGSFRTTDFGATWQDIGTPFGISRVDNCKALANGGLAALVQYPQNNEMVFTSNDNGLTWKKLNGSPVATAVDVASNGVIVGVATASGFYKNFANGNFLNPSNNGITAFDVRSQVIQDGLFLAGTADGPWRSFDNGTNWLPSFPQGQLLGTQEVKIKGDTLYAITESNFFYSVDGGDSWVNPYVSGGWGIWGPFDEAHNFAFDGDILLVSGYDSYKSTDFGQNWDEFLNFANCSGIVVAEGKYFTLATWDGIMRSSDQGATWQIVKSGILGQGRMYYFHNKVFACLDPGMLRSSNLGNTWGIPTGLPTHGPFNTLLPVMAMAANDTIIYAAINHAGIYKSLDDGASWSLFSDALPNLRFNDLILDNGVLYAACSDGGIWKYDLNIVGAPAPALTQGLWIYPNPVRDQTIQVHCFDNQDGPLQILVYDGLGQQVLSQSLECASDKIELNLQSLVPGLYRLATRSNTHVRVGCFIKI